MSSNNGSEGGSDDAGQDTIFTCRRPGCEDREFRTDELEEHREYHRKLRENKRKKRFVIKLFLKHFPKFLSSLQFIKS